MKTIKSNRVRQAVQIVLAAGLTSGFAQAASFISFSTLQGESTDKDHKGWSDVINFSQAVSKSACPSFTVFKTVDTISPAMAEAGANGGKFDTAAISTTASYTDAGRVEYFRADMQNVVVQGVKQFGGGEEPVSEEILLTPSIVTITYRQTDFSGKSKGNVVTSYSCKGKP